MRRKTCHRKGRRKTSLLSGSSGVSLDSQTGRKPCYSGGRDVVSLQYETSYVLLSNRSERKIFHIRSRKKASCQSESVCVFSMYWTLRMIWHNHCKRSVSLLYGLFHVNSGCWKWTKFCYKLNRQIYSLCNDFGCGSLVYLELGKLYDILDICVPWSTVVQKVLSGQRIRMSRFEYSNKDKRQNKWGI